MYALNHRWLRWGLIALITLFCSAASLIGAPVAQAQTPLKVGIVCTNSSSPNPSFTLTTQVGYILLPDGNTMYMWGFSAGNGGFQHPGPVLCVNEGDTVTVVLHNTFAEAVSIVFPGQENVLANGVPVQPQFDGNNKMTSLTTVAPANGGSVTYSFVATHPGTFIYESGTNPQKQVNMGLFGALIVYPTHVSDSNPLISNVKYAYNRADSAFMPQEEFMVLLSEIDPYQHQRVEQQAANPNLPDFNMNNYHARYWLINGRGFPDSIADNGASFLPTQPYGALALVHEFNTDTNAGINYHPYPGLARYLNVGTEPYPFHPHGNNGRVMGRDGHPLEDTGAEDLSFEKYAINIGPGQTWDVLVQWHDAEQYSPSNPVPVVVPQVANQAFGQFYGGSPYLGETGTLPPGSSTLNQCGEFYIIAHNHALYQITSWGVNMTGPITYMRVDPPLPNNCQ
ncbi:MAG: multicopper oxidase domain-containing protein [Caldilineaceae bacterium]